MEQRKLQLQTVQSFVSDLNVLGAEVSMFPIESFMERDAGLLSQCFDAETKHVVFHKPQPLFLGPNTASMREFYERFISTVPNLQSQVYDSLEQIEKAFMLRTNSKALLQCNSVLASHLAPQSNIETDKTQREILKIGGRVIIDPHGEYAPELHREALMGVGDNSLVVLKPTMACVQKNSHLMHVVRAPLDCVVTIASDYTYELFIESNYIYKVYVFAGKAVLIRKTKHYLHPDCNYCYIGGQRDALYDWAEVLPLGAGEEGEIGELTRLLAGHLGVVFFSYDLLRDVKTGRLYIIDVNYNTFPKSGDGIAAAIISGCQ